MSKPLNKKKTKKAETKLSKPTLRFNDKFEKLLSYKQLGLILAAAYLIIVGIISFVYHVVGDYGIETDFFWSYVPQGKEFLNGSIPMDAFRGPLYPMVLGIFGFILGDFFKAGILIGILSASAVIYFTFELLKRIFGNKISFFVTLLLAFNPVFVQYSYSAGTDMFFSALVTITLFFFFKEKKLSYKNLIIAAVVGGLSYLTRYNGVFLVSFIVVILFVNYWNINWKERLRASAVFIFVFILTFSPWGFHCLSEKGSFFYNENYKNIAYEMYGKGKISWDQFWFNESKNATSFAEVIFKDPGVFVSKIIGNIGNHFVEDMSNLVGWYLGVFIVLGLFLLIISNPLKEWKNRKTGYFITNIFFFLLLLLVFYGERFSLFLIPFYAVLAVQPFFIERLKLQKIIPAALSYVIMIGLLVFTFVNSYSFNSKNIDSGPKELLTLKEWYDNNVSENERGKKIASRKAHVAYYLDMKFSLLPLANSYDELISSLQKNEVDYLYYSTMEAAMRPQFQFLLNPKQNHPGLQPVVFFKNPPSVLYKVLNE